jgi:sulfotransferase 6B1
MLRKNLLLPSMKAAEARRWLGQSERLRAGRILAIRAAARAAKPGQGPPIFLNSIPKAGTHLLMQALDELPDLRPSGTHLIKAKVVIDDADPIERSIDVDWDVVRRVLSRNARPGQYVTAHTWAHPELFELLDEYGYATLFVIRDPRDIVVSQAAYVTRLRRHPDHVRFATHIADDQDRYRTIIRGYEEDDAGPAGVSLAERLEGYAPWLDHERVTVCRFEELVGRRGGGTDAEQLEALSEVAAAVGLHLDRAAAAELAERVWSPRSATFNRGRIGAWRENFDQATRELFDASVSGELMSVYGYGD